MTVHTNEVVSPYGTTTTSQARSEAEEDDPELVEETDDEDQEDVRRASLHWERHRPTDGWRDARQRTLERDDYACVVCGLTHEEHRRRDDLFGRGLHVHHLTPVAEFDDPAEAHVLDNLVTLCADHHSQVERGELNVELNEDSAEDAESWISGGPR